MEEVNSSDLGAEKCDDTIELAVAEAAPASALPTQSVELDQPAPTPTATPMDLFETPINAGAPTASSGETVDEIAKEEVIAMDMAECPNEIIDNSIVPSSNGGDDLLLHFGGSFEGGSAEVVTNHQNSPDGNVNLVSDFDLLGFAPTEPQQTFPLPDANLTASGGLVLDPFAPVDSELNLLGLSDRSSEANDQEGLVHDVVDSGNKISPVEDSDSAEKLGSEQEIERVPNDNEETPTLNADSIFEQQAIEDNPRNESALLSIGGDAVVNEMIHATTTEIKDIAAPYDVSPEVDEIIESQPSTAHESKDGIANQSSDGENIGASENALSSIGVGGDAMADEAAMTHATTEEVNIIASPKAASPVIDEDIDNDNQPSTAHEGKGQEELTNQSSDVENAGTNIISSSDRTKLFEAEHIVEVTTNDVVEAMNTQLTIEVDTPVALSSVSVVTTQNAPQHGTETREQTKVDGSVSDAQVNTDAEERTEEEEEWLSMGLGLGDALRQIVALTEERDSSLELCQEKDNGKTQAEALLVEVQSRLEAEMNRRAESDSEKRKLRETLKSYEERLSKYETMEDDLEKANANLVTVVTEKSKIELEVQKLRDMIDESQQKEAVLSNRLNEAKKKEANKSTAAGRLEEENEKLRLDLQATKDEFEAVSKAKAKLESNMEKLKVKAVERVKQAETALSEERELNEERKKKMKTFVETKAEELREAKECASNMQKELEETRASLRSSRDREEATLKELEAARLKHRELQRDMERMVRNSEQLHKAGNNLEQELEKYASETEEHKKKRMSAKHEIMQMVRTLEAERAVSAKLRESVKFTFTPKALSQQELLTECLRDFESELERLAAKTGKSLQPSTEPGGSARGESTTGGTEATEINGSLSKSKKPRGSKADVDTERLISNLEQETQHVSKGIMALAGDIERMRSLLNDDNAFGCLAYFSNILPRTGEARHQRLGDGSDAHYEKNSTDRFV
ncbi:hypothetical protein ACHAWU_002853 [Discostella pseudostelligera]|uniref:Uncharacterized protein n=1 Tax=Discostella pseudostelligera TaxID=259834 RepID=A0ABD3M2G6_9STRA